MGHGRLWLLGLAALAALLASGACAGGDDTADTRTPFGDGSTGKDSGGETPGITGCGPVLTVCNALGAECGKINDPSCFGQRDCGDCPPGLTCGGIGVENKCGCQAKSCSTLARTCGIAADGCGGLIDCGTCTGTDLCNAQGKCGVCKQGEACSATNPCVKSTMECSGTPKCVDAGFQPSGTSCGPGLTCDGSGTCTCKPKSCADVGVQCGKISDGCGGTLECPSCPVGQVCNASGKCTTCVQGSPCQASAACLTATMDCAGGTPTCKDTGKQPQGASCGTGFQCNGQGECVCQPKSCSALGKACGSWNDGCGGTVQCPTCGTGKICNSSGQCVDCVQGSSCAASSACKTATVGCSSGTPVCNDTGNVAPGLSCGSGYVCNGSGSCVACAQGSSCSTGNPCENGGIDCGTGSAVCKATGNKPDGTPCGTGQVCKGGSCQAAVVCGDGKCDPGESCKQDCCDADLKPGESLSLGQQIQSCDGRFTLVMQAADGNLVLYGPPGALWSSNTSGIGASYAVMQGDGNFVVYSPSSALWYSNTAGYNGAYLVAQDDGNLVIYLGGSPIWSTGTCCY